MNGELAQVAALVAYCEAYLQAEPDTPAPELSPSHSTFQYIHDLAFARKERRFAVIPIHAVVARATGAWCWDLRVRGAAHVRLWVAAAARDLPAHIAAAFSGGGTWGIQVELTGSLELWTPRWVARHRGHPENRIWSVTYVGQQLDAPLVQENPGPGHATAELRKALHYAREFAARTSHGGWGDLFDEAACTLEQEAPEIPYHPDLIPSTLDAPVARRLLAAASKAWVFGGMGSWNDAYFEAPDQQREYESVTSRLYAAVLGAVAAATNSLHPSSSIPAA